MSLTFFSKPSDTEVLNKLIEKDEIITFIGQGSVHQNLNETVYIRKVKVKVDKVEVLKNVVYIKKGITWLFNRIEMA